MTMLYYRANVKRKQAMTKAEKSRGLPCPFCDISQLAGVVRETDTMRVVNNRMPYDLFDGVPVAQHLMVTPKQHRETLKDFTTQEKGEYFDILADYERLNFTIYSRGIKNKTRTAVHVHTHLLLLEQERVKAMLYIDRPYFLLHPGRFRSRKKVQG